MKVELKNSCKEIAEGLNEGIYDVPDGATIEELVSVAERESGLELDDSVKNSFVFLVNGMPQEWHHVLGGGDKLRILYKILGG